MDKISLRALLKERVSLISDKREQSELIAQKVKTLRLPQGSICIYNSLDCEADTVDLIDYFIQTREVYLPVVEGEDILLVKVDSDTQYTVGRWGIREPRGERIAPKTVAPQITVTPLLGADKNLNRLGKGKGYYDRYFASIGETYKVGLAFREQIVDRVPADKWDKTLDALITPDEIIERK